MKLSTIWTIPAMTLHERLSRTTECAVRAIAHRLPRRLAYWSFIDTAARHIGPDDVVPDVRVVDVLSRADR